MDTKSLRGGAKVWYFPDGYLPKKESSGEMEAHEAIMIMNVNDRIVNVKMDVYFEDKDPIKNISVEVGAERVVSLRLDMPEHTGGFQIPLLLNMQSVYDLTFRLWQCLEDWILLSQTWPIILLVHIRNNLLIFSFKLLKASFNVE